MAIAPKTARVHFVCSPAEKRLFRRAADASGERFSVWLRRVLRRGAEREIDAAVIRQSRRPEPRSVRAAQEAEVD